MYLYDEVKEIKSICVGTGEECDYWEVGLEKLNGQVPTKIVAEQVGGEMGYVTWFAVYAGEELVARVNQSFVSSVGY